MKALVRFLFFTVPHFRTIYYLEFVDSRGQRYRKVLGGPTDIPEEERHYIFCCHCFFFLGKPCFPHYYAYAAK